MRVMDRTCTDCRQAKPLEQFPKHPNARDGRRRQCLPCHNTRARARYIARPDRRQRPEYPPLEERVLVYRRRQRLKKRGLTIEEHDAMIAAQGNRCAICRRMPEEAGERWPTLPLDHDHRTGKPRALLCSRCNRMLGLCDDDPAIFDAAAAYLRRWGDASTAIQAPEPGRIGDPMD